MNNNRKNGVFRRTNRWFGSFTLANRLTLLRIALLPVYLLLLAIPRTRVVPAFIVFLVACATDFLDGYLARSMNEKSSAGALLDPIADKLLVIPPLIYFASLQMISPWYVIIIVMRELIISAFRLVAMTNGKVVSANMFGKVKTVLQLILLGSLTLNLSLLSAILAPIAALVTVASLVEYMNANRGILSGLKR
jgi:CDP-diacylglycerol--glycerol-3-phosphate 3-phosphatidyltransferase